MTTGRRSSSRKMQWEAEGEMAEVAEHLGTDIAQMKRRAEELSEANPMLGHRGCRLVISFP